MTKLKHLIFGVTGTPELGRVLFMLMVLSFIIYQAVAFWKGDPWNPVAFAAGGGGLLTGGGGGILLKDLGVVKALGKGDDVK